MLGFSCHKTRKCFPVPVLLFAVLLLLSGCSASAKSEKEIVADLRQSSEFIGEAVKIDDYEIIKRQTDKNNNTDLIYITVTINEDELNCTLSYIMQYILYNDGWKLESVNRYFDGVWSIGGLTTDHILEDIKKFDPLFSQCVDLNFTEHEIDGPYLADDDYKLYSRVSITAENDQIIYQPCYLMYYRVEENRWENESFSIESDYFRPIQKPDQQYAEDLGKNLRCLKEYDSYRYFVTMSDLENCMATIHYRADRIYEYGTETDDIAVPCVFYRSSDEGVPAWHYNAEDVEIEFDFVDWNIEGVWTSEGIYRDDGFSRWVNWDVWLSISDISYTESKEEFLAKVSCDATYCEDNDESYYGLIPKHSSHQCKTQDAVIVTIRRGEQGGYSFSIPEQTWGISSFSIELEPDNTGWSGICWKFSLWSTGLPEPQLTRETE